MINKFKKIILGIGLISLIGTGFFATGLQLAEAVGKTVVVDTRDAGIIPDTELNDDDANFLNVVQTVINWILGFLGIIVFGLFLIAGFTYATAGGDEAKTKKAVSTMTNAVIGLIILFFAFSATNLIVGFALNVQ